MPLDGVLLEACRKCGGASALARQLGISRQSVYGFSIDGFSEERIEQISELTNISRERLRRYSEEKANIKYRRLEQEQHYRPESKPRPEPPRNPEELIAIARTKWRFFDPNPLWRDLDLPPPYPHPSALP